MNNRERFRAAMAFEKTDRPCHVEHGFWDETYARWRQEGLPEGVCQPVLEYLGPRPDLFDYFEITHMTYVLRSQYFLPPFPEEVLEETDHYKIVKDALGRTLKLAKDCASLPQDLDYPIKTQRDFAALKERLAPALSQRYPENWERLADQLRNQDEIVVCTHMDGFFAHPRELMGVHNLLMAFYTEPELVRDIINTRVDFYIALFERAFRDVRPDYAFIWEDMSFKNGPLVSPEIFREFMLPAYKKLTDFIRQMGVNNIIVDSDGDIRQLIPLWIEGGVTGSLPFEAKTPMNILEVARAFPKFQMMGGINKHLLEDGHTKNEIDAELNRVLPEMLTRGGYCVSLDHWVQPEIPLANYRHYVECVRTWGMD